MGIKKITTGVRIYLAIVLMLHLGGYFLVIQKEYRKIYLI